MTKTPHLWLRGETKKNEQRTAIPPSACQTLLKAGFAITVEECEQRVFDVSEYRKCV